MLSMFWCASPGPSCFGNTGDTPKKTRRNRSGATPDATVLQAVQADFDMMAQPLRPAMPMIPSTDMPTSLPRNGSIPSTGSHNSLGELTPNASFGGYAEAIGRPSFDGSAMTTPRENSLNGSMAGEPMSPHYITIKSQPTPDNSPVRRNTPYSYQPAPPPPKETLVGAAHQPLVGACDFIPMPAISSRETPVNQSTAFPVYIAQAKFETSPAHVRWLVRHMTGKAILPVAVEHVSQGCFVAFVQSEAEQDAVVAAMHRRLLFDHNGVWCPRNATQTAALAGYMSDREFRMRGQRLPRELLSADKQAPNARVPAQSEYFVSQGALSNVART